MRRMYSEEQVKKMIQNALSSGDMKDVKVFENIVDKDGHNRFIDGDITLATISGLTQTYGKWSLSGTHLLIVLGFDIAVGTSFGNIILANVVIPNWILNKIYPLFATNVVMSTTFSARADDYTGVDIGVLLIKGSQDLGLYMSNSLTSTTKLRHVRVAFDLLIDNE